MTDRLTTHADLTPPEAEPVCAVGGDKAPGASRQPPERPPVKAKSKAVLPLASSPPPLPSRSVQPDIEPVFSPPDVRPWWKPMGHQETSSFLASFVLHALLIVSLAFVLPGLASQGDSFHGVIASNIEPVPLESAVPMDDVSVEFHKRAQRRGDSALPDEVLEVPKIQDLPRAPVASTAAPPTDLGRDPSRWSELFVRSSTATGGGLEGRKNRPALAAKHGATPESEDAVERGLKWLLAHQRENGSWDFDHTKGACGGLCRNPGSAASTTAATGCALLAFLGAGYTHTDGQYQDAVQRGLYYLSSRAVMTPHGADLREGTMYAQGISALTLCEAYGMTEDPALRDIAQKALDFIIYAQDKRGGGWRYRPQEPGDTTVTGWQLMALRSGQMAGLNVPSPSIVLAVRFLDGVEADGGAKYGYLDQAPRNSTTAVGLLLRMYTGWGHETPALARGLKHLDKWGPSRDDIYYDYYATQVMHHWQGPLWERWNRTMRDYLVASQATEGHESGSWYFDGSHTRSGGRLFSTCAAIMTLEVYYRYMPLYGGKRWRTAGNLGSLTPSLPHQRTDTAVVSGVQSARANLF